MKIITDISVTSRPLRARGAAFAPLSLFDTGLAGAYYLPDAANTVHRDTLGQTSAGFGESVGRVDDLSPNQRHALQASAALRPVLGRAPTRGRVNTILGSELLNTNGGAWVSTVFARYENLHGKQYLVHAGAGSSSFRRAPVFPGEYAFSWFWLPQNPTQTISIARSSGVFAAVVATIFADGSVDGSVGEERVTVNVLPTGEVRISVHTTVTGGSGGRNYFWNLTAGGSGETWLTGAQIEENTATSTAYQRVTTAFNVTEAGVPSPAFLRFDLADDVLLTSFPTGGTFDVLVFGRKGSWIVRDVTIAPAGTLALGPTTLTSGPPGLLAALGDIVGWFALRRTLTSLEVNSLVKHHRRYGAGTLLESI